MRKPDYSKHIRQEQTTYLMRGLPGSGKSTIARAMAADRTLSPRVRRVNRDDVRRMIGDYNEFNDTREKLVTHIEEETVRSILAVGDSVIVDDCNLNPAYVTNWTKIAEDFGRGRVPVQIIDLSDTPLRICQKRNAGRPVEERVQDKVITQMWARWIQRAYKPHPHSPLAIICDIDGTLALMGDRNPYDASTCEQDAVNTPVADLVQKYKDDGHFILLCSGREEKFRDQTERWLMKNEIDFDLLFMRSTRDSRPDFVVKHDIYLDEIKGKFNVVLCLDDRDQIVDMWRAQGLTCWQVNEGNF